MLPTTNKALVKRPRNQTTPIATDAFVNISEQGSIEKYLTGMNIFY
jgi:hypothetical protein